MFTFSVSRDVGNDREPRFGCRSQFRLLQSKHCSEIRYGGKMLVSRHRETASEVTDGLERKAPAGAGQMALTRIWRGGHHRGKQAHPKRTVQTTGMPFSVNTQCT